jgi:thiamine biosynthesis lipoprotein
MRCVRDVMGMPVTVDVRDEAENPAALDEVYADLVFVDQTFSPFLPDSAISRINRGEVSPDDVDPVVLEVLDLCRLYEKATDGYFSAWIGGRLDPSGLVKGWAIGRAASILDRHGYRNYFVDAAGDIVARGHSGQGTPWRVGIRHPVERERVARVILASELAIATSGTYEKGSHIYDPHTGRPVEDLLSLTVVGPNVLDADVYATAAFAMGARGLEFVDRLDGYQAYAIDTRLRATWTAGFPAPAG